MLCAVSPSLPLQAADRLGPLLAIVNTPSRQRASRAASVFGEGSVDFPKAADLDEV